MPAWIYVLALGAFGLITTELGIIGILPQLGAAFGVSVQTAGWLLSGFALAIALAGPGMTLLFSRFDRRRSLCFVLALFVLSNLGSALAPTFGWLLALRVLPAFVHPVFWSVAMAVAAAGVPPERSSRAVSIVFAGMSAGIVFGVPLAAFCAGQASWHAAFVVFGALNLLALVAHWLFLPGSLATDHASVGAQVRVLRKGVLWWNLVLQVVLTAAVFSMYGFMAEFLKDVTGMGPRLISAMLLLFGVAGVAGTRVAGRFMGRHLTRLLLLFIASFGPILALLFVFGHSMPVMIGMVVVWGLIHAAAVPLCQALVMRAAPEAPAFSNSLFNSFGNIGITCGTALGGQVIALKGIATLPLAGLGLLVLAAGIALAERMRYASTAA
jgi:MFS transporter, DHA1 family, inner membrane transport protein